MPPDQIHLSLRDVARGWEPRTPIPGRFEHDYTRLAEKLRQIPPHPEISHLNEWMNNNPVRLLEMECIAYFTSEVWEKVREDGYLDPANFSTTIIFPEGKLRSTPRLLDLQRPRKKLDVLKIFIGDVTDRSIAAWKKDMQDNPNPDKQYVYQWLQENIPYIRAALEVDFSPNETPEQIIADGFTTALIATLNSLFAVPAVYQAYRNNRDTRVEDTAQQVDILPFVMKLASGSIHYVPLLIEMLSQNPRRYREMRIGPFAGEEAMYAVFDPKNLTIMRDVSGRLLLDTSETFLRVFAGEETDKQLMIQGMIGPVTGCPAMPFIPEFVRWCTQLYEYYHLPTLSSENRRWNFPFLRRAQAN